MATASTDPSVRDPFRLLASAVRRTAEAVVGRQPTGLVHDDADDELGTLGTDGALGFDPRPLLKALDRAGVEVTVIGQVAGILHGSQELTGDLDLLWDGSARFREGLAAAFAEVGARLSDDDHHPLTCDAATFAAAKLQFDSSEASGDLCTPALPWGSLAVGDFIRRARHVRHPDGWTVRWLQLDDLNAMRRAVGRPKDLRRVAEFEQPTMVNSSRRQTPSPPQIEADRG